MSQVHYNVNLQIKLQETTILKKILNTHYKGQ